MLSKEAVDSSWYEHISSQPKDMLCEFLDQHCPGIGADEKALVPS
jgi:hypothetical protein